MPKAKTFRVKNGNSGVVMGEVLADNPETRLDRSRKGDRQRSRRDGAVAWPDGRGRKSRTEDRRGARRDSRAEAVGQPTASP